MRLGPLLGLSLVLGSIGCETRSGGAEQPPAKKGPGGERPPALVETAEVRTGRMEDKWRFLGDIRASDRASIAAGASGAVTRMYVREGDRVERGALLMEIDPALSIARLETTKSEADQGRELLAQAVRERDRLAGLEKNVVPAVELERAHSRVRELEARLKGTEAKVQEAQAELALHRIRAPFAGAVARRLLDLGDWVRPGDPALELVSTESVEVLVDASRELFKHVKNGDVAQLIGEGKLDAKVVGVVPALDPSTRTMRVRLSPAEDASWLIPGSAVNVEFAVDLSDQGVVVPQDALLSGPTETKLIRVVDGKAEPLKVVVLARAQADALVQAEGLSVGDQIVVRGNERLRPGQPVKVQ